MKLGFQPLVAFCIGFGLSYAYFKHRGEDNPPNANGNRSSTRTYFNTIAAESRADQRDEEQQRIVFDRMNLVDGRKVKCDIKQLTIATKSVPSSFEQWLSSLQLQDFVDAFEDGQGMWKAAVVKAMQPDKIKVLFLNDNKYNFFFKWIQKSNANLQLAPFHSHTAYDVWNLHHNFVIHRCLGTSPSGEDLFFLTMAERIVKFNLRSKQSEVLETYLSSATDFCRYSHLITEDAFYFSEAGYCDCADDLFRVFRLRLDIDPFNALKQLKTVCWVPKSKHKVYHFDFVDEIFCLFVGDLKVDKLKVFKIDSNGVEVDFDDGKSALLHSQFNIPMHWMAKVGKEDKFVISGYSSSKQRWMLNVLDFRAGRCDATEVEHNWLDLSSDRLFLFCKQMLFVIGDRKSNNTSVHVLDVRSGEWHSKTIQVPSPWCDFESWKAMDLNDDHVSFMPLSRFASSAGHVSSFIKFHAFDVVPVQRFKHRSSIHHKLVHGFVRVASHRMPTIVADIVLSYYPPFVNC